MRKSERCLEAVPRETTINRRVEDVRRVPARTTINRSGVGGGDGHTTINRRDNPDTANDKINSRN